jgi:hypothetical protein
MLAVMFIQPDKASGIDHFGRLETGATIFSDHLPKCEIGESSHRCLKNRWIHNQRSNAQGL